MKNYEQMARQFSMILFNPNGDLAFSTYMNEKNELKKKHNIQIQEIESEFIHEINSMILKGFNLEGAYTMLGINSSVLHEKINEITNPLQQAYVTQLAELKKPLRAVIQTDPAFAPIRDLVFFAETDFDFMKVVGKKIFDFTGKIIKKATPDVQLRFGLLFDALYFSFDTEDNEEHEEEKRSLIEEQHDYLRIRIMRSIFVKAMIQYEELNDVLGPNDELYFHLRNYRIASEERSQANTDHYQKEQDWFRTDVIEAI